MWQNMMVIGVPLAEKTIRTIAVYLALAVLLKLVGRREVAQLTGFDLVVMLLLSNVVQNAIIGPDNSLLGGLFGAVVLLAINAVVVRLAVALPPGDSRLSRAWVLARDGGYNIWRLRWLGLRRSDVDQVIRAQGGDDVAETSLVTLEPGGAVVVRLREQEQNASRGDMAELLRRLDRIEALLIGLR